MFAIYTKLLSLFGEERYAKIYVRTVEIFSKASELMNARKYDEATPIVKSGLNYMQKHFRYFKINSQILNDYDNFFHKEKLKYKELDLPQVGKIIEEYINTVRPKLGDHTTDYLSMYIYLFQFDLFLNAWNEALKPHRTKQ